MFTKSVEMQFERDGKRPRFVGFVGQLTDESGVVLHSQLYTTKDSAQMALDTLAHELLIDYAERGLVDTLPEPATATKDHTLYVVTNGAEYAVWDNKRGCWNATERFGGECLHGEYDAKDVLQKFNNGRDENDPAWALRKAHIQIVGCAPIEPAA